MIGLRRIFVLLCIIGVSGQISYAQSKKVWLHKADEFYAKQDYASALENYKKVVNDSAALKTLVLPYEHTVSNQKFKKSDSTKLNSPKTVDLRNYTEHQIAMCYKLTYDYGHALDYFKKTKDLGAYPDDHYYYAHAMMNLGQYEEAIAEYNAYLKSGNASDEYIEQAQKDLVGCYLAMSDENQHMEVQVSMADTNTFNKGTSSFAVQYWDSEDKLIFTSARDHGVVLDPVKQQSEFLCDLYWTEREYEDSWLPATNFGRPLNSAKHDAAGCFNNNNVIYYTRWSDENRTEKHIYLARMVAMRFFESYKLDSNVNIAGHSSVQPYITPEGKWMYFSSNRPGGAGGMDIWRVELDEEGLPMGPAENLGDPVNSSFDEVTPFFHQTTATLFFSSNGKNSIGGLDVFKSSMNLEGGTFGAPKNLGQPINSSYDDAYMIWDMYLKTGWFSSDREPCENGHCYNVYHVKNEPIVISIEGFVFDNETQEPIPNATVVIKDIEYKMMPAVITCDDEGFYSAELEQNMELFMKAQKPGYFADAASQTTKGITESTVLMQDFFLNKIPNEPVAIEGIEYDFDKATLRPKSKEILDELVKFLELNDNLVVEIQSHTDSRGNDAYNLDLSERRAQSVVDYLLDAGIPKSRLEPKGYGETTPSLVLDENKKPVKDDKGEFLRNTSDYINSLSSRDAKEEAHQRNRRTAFKVLTEDHEVVNESANQ